MLAYSLLLQNALNLSLKPISLRGLLFLSYTPCDIYGAEDGIYKVLLRKNSYLNTTIIKNLIEQGHSKIFVKHELRHIFAELLHEELRKATRSLSVGNILDNARKLVNLLSINMSYLYEYPTNDAALSLQYQSVKNLGLFLYSKPDIHEPLYREILKQKHHFIVSQPLVSSLFLIGILKNARLFSEKEVEALFITSYFKDIGMSSIPTEKYEQDNLSNEDKLLLARHAQHSVQILSGRIPLGPNYLRIIENHHSFSLLTRELSIDDESSHQLAKGFETMIVSVCDIIAAMIAERPYRPAVAIFEALELIKVLIVDDFPHEFRLIVSYFKIFFQK